MNAPPNIALLPDEDQLTRFVAAIFKHADPRGIVSLRAFLDATKDSKPLFIEPISLLDPQFQAIVSERARQAAQWHVAAVFCPPLATFKNPDSAKADNILEGPALSVECDANPRAASATLKKLLGEPTVAVASGGEWIDPETGAIEQKRHLHWRLKTPARTAGDLALLREARDMATKLVGGDATNIPVCHPIRWPGTWHRKKEPPRPARIVRESENEIDLSDALAILCEATGAQPSEGVEFSRESELEAANPKDVASALRVIPNENLEWSDWNHIGLATWGATGGSEQGYEAFAAWSAKSSKNDPAATAARWKHYATSPPDRVGFGTLVYVARRFLPGWKPEGRQGAQPKGLAATPWVWRDPKTIPPREFLYGKHYIRKFVSAGFGAPGGGKSSKRLVEALAMASGRALLGVKPVKKLKVWYWNGEDPSEETDRRLAAACLYYGIKPEEIEGYLFADSGRETPIIIAQQAKTGTLIANPVVEDLKAGIKERGLDVMILDPFVSCHRVAENDNPAIDAVVKKFAEIADVTACSVELEHHIRKTNGNEATVDDGRGASSLVGAARSIEVLNKMTPAEAERLGLDQHWRYFSVDDGKANMAPLGERKWFKFASVTLGNSTELYPEGDDVGVATTWAPPNHSDGVTGNHFDLAAAKIRAGNFKESSQAKDWVGIPVAKVLGVDLTTKEGKAKVKHVLSTWIKSGALTVVEETDPKRREPKKFVRVADDE